MNLRKELGLQYQQLITIGNIGVYTDQTLWGLLIPKYEVYYNLYR